MVCPHCGRAAYVTQKQEDKAVDSFAEQLPQSLPSDRYVGLTNLEIELIQHHIVTRIPFKVETFTDNQRLAIQKIAFDQEVTWREGSGGTKVVKDKFFYFEKYFEEGMDISFYLNHKDAREIYDAVKIAEIFLQKPEEEQQ